MAIIFPYKSITPEQKDSLYALLGKFKGEVSQCSLHSGEVQLVLNKEQITPVRGQEFIDAIIDIVKPDRWGTDLGISFPERNIPPYDCYPYAFSIPYDPNVD